MIKFQCQYCGSKYQISDSYAGKKVKCQKCSKVLVIPAEPIVSKDTCNASGNTTTENLKAQAITIDDEPLGMSTVAKVGIGVIITVLILFIGFVIWFISNRDTWESKHGYEIIHLCEEIYPLLQSKDPNAGIQKYNDLLLLIGNHKLIYNDTNKAVSDVREIADPLKRKMLEEQRLKEKKQKEVEILSQLTALESQAKSFVDSEDFERGIEKYQEALNLVKDIQTDNADVISFIGRISQAKTLAREKLSYKMQAEEAIHKRIEEDKKLARIKANIKGGAWLTKKAGNSETIRGLKIFAVKSIAKNEQLIAMLHATWKGDRERIEQARDEMAKLQQLEEDLKKKMDAAKDPEVLEKGINLFIKIIAEKNKVQKRRDALELIFKNTQELLEKADKVNSSDPVDLKTIFSVVSENALAGENATWDSICSQLLVGQTHTDIDGKYSIELPGGGYYLYATFDSAYSRVDWFVPIRIGEAKDISVDLLNENAFRITNKNKDE